MVKTFAEMFGSDAYVERPTANGFTVFSKPPQESGKIKAWNAEGDSEEPKPVAWQYDPKTQTYTNPVTNQVASIADLGIRDPITASFEVGRLASKEGKNIDQWSAYGPQKSNESYGANADEYRGALTRDLPKIRAYDAKGGMLDKVLDYAPMAIMAFSGFGAALGNVLASAGMNATLASVASGAASGALTSAASGGNIAKGALMGGAGGAIGSVTSNLEGGANFVGPTDQGLLSTSNLASGVGSAALAAATGGNAGAALVGSLAGSGVRNITGSSAAGTLASKATGLLMADDQKSQGGGLGGSPAAPASTGLINTPAATTQPAPAPATAPENPQPSGYTGTESASGFALAVPIEFQSISRRNMNWGSRTGG